MIFAIIFLSVVLLIGLIIEGINFSEFGAPVSDKDLLEALGEVPEAVEDPSSWRYSDGVDKDYIKIKLITGKTCKFQKPEYSLLFSYYDYNLGVVPIWYKSAEVIKKAHEARMKEVGIKQSSREKLGF